MADVFRSGQCSDPPQLKSADDGASPFPRIEFHLARKPFKGFNNDGSDFRPETLNPGTSGGSDSRRPGSGGSGQGQSGSGAKKSDGSEFVENGWDPELSFPITFRRIGAGLINMGNTCYLNSVLQCLTYTEPLAAYLQSGRHRNSCHIKNGFCALCAIQEHVSLALQSTKSILPKALVFNLQRISRNFRKSRQEDAHEYMVNLLESMHKCCLPSGVPSESPSAYEKSLVHKIFGGRLRSRVKCLQCSYCSDKLDPFLDLSLEIVKANSLNKALVNFTSEEQLDGGERQYQCQKCNHKVRASKQMTIHKPPSVLTIHLKRFRAHDPGQKINKEVQFGPTLDLRPFVSGPYPEGDLKYTLYGVLVHCGASTYSGHYYCFVRTSTGIWHSLDDNNVRQVREMTVLQQKAYMLFYVRDRRNIIPRKPVDVAQMEYFKQNGIGNKITPPDNHLPKEPIRKIAAVNRSSDLASSRAQKDASAIVTRVSHLKEASVDPNNGHIVTQNMVHKEAILESSSKASLSEGSLGQNMPPCNPLPSSKTGTSDSASGGDSTTDAKINECNEKASSNDNDRVSIVILPTVKDPETLKACKPVQDEISQNKNHAPSAGNLSVASSTIPSGLPLEKLNPEKPSDPPSSRISQAGSFINEREKGSDSGQIVVVADSAKLVDSLVLTDRSLDVEAPDRKQPKGLKKKHIKCKVAGMHMHPSLLSRAVLRVQKKKHKSSKHPTSDRKSHSKKYLLENCCSSSDQGPSTSEKTQTDSLVSVCSKRKRNKSGLKTDEDGTSDKYLVNSRGDCSMDIKDVELRGSLIHNGTVLANDKLQQNGLGSSSVTLENQRESRGTDAPQNCKRDEMQNGWKVVLTQGPAETIVAPWDGIELPQSHVVESSHAPVTIGYVGDEWDEEYDRGKRKKVRQAKLSLGGSNPFQMLANKKAQLKKPRIQRFDSGNRPLRI
ncbi:PREDICTED: ubiquitin carboxyl-terminal hydrolase 23 isoform X1 [Fragaria vesca subsp. vesca]|uniref:ubiquitin carboxyl-terminal hydrolase 23 isoform X1 n=1 Tax=Fragaria vesca subsp. vesca TaxID=101020 RepID=UPI0002C3533B|nr:PREDICTED: ubiquitin carboxyl-terminal hydrolase 23 isoform X1 [Fragaria vesca subsp. vesca]